MERDCYFISKKAFTIVELLVVIGIIATLSSIILFSISQYISKGKDASIKSNLVVLVPSGEVYYNNKNSYLDILNGTDFCDYVVDSAFSQLPTTQSKYCGVNITGTAWAACVQEFTNTEKAYCVDSKGNRGEIDNSLCTNSITTCP